MGVWRRAWLSIFPSSSLSAMSLIGCVPLLKGRFLSLPFPYSHSLQVVSLVATTPTVASLRKLHHHLSLSLYPAHVLVNSLIINSTRLFRMSVPSVSCCDSDCYTWLHIEVEGQALESWPGQPLHTVWKELFSGQLAASAPFTLTSMSTSHFV